MRTLSGTRILVVDDDADVRALVGGLLSSEGAVMLEAADGREALAVLRDGRPDLIVVDAGPDPDGGQPLARIRDFTDVPVLLLTTREDGHGHARSLPNGADDRVTKPFGGQELVARCGALVRRARETAAGADAAAQGGYADSLIAIDVANARVQVAGVEVTLTPLELRLLTAFVRHPGQVLHRDQLLGLVWGAAATAAPEQVKLYVGYLRRKLEPALGAGNGPIETVRGSGYRYRPTGG